MRIAQEDFHPNDSVPAPNSRECAGLSNSSAAKIANIPNDARAVLLCAVCAILFVALTSLLFGMGGAVVACLFMFLTGLMIGAIRAMSATSSDHGRVALDAVTGLPGKGHFMRELDLACRHAECGAMAGVVCVQIDLLDVSRSDGKTVASDVIERIVADCLVANVRRSDCVVRIDIGRFAILQRLIRSPDACAGLNDRLTSRLLDALHHAETGHHIAVRIGTALASQDVVVPSKVLAAAEQALMRQLIDNSGGERRRNDAAQKYPNLRQASTSNKLEESVQLAFDLGCECA